MPAYRDDCLALGVVRLELRVVVARTFEEKLGRVLVAQPGHARYAFTPKAQRLTAGGQHRQARRRSSSSLTSGAAASTCSKLSITSNARAVPASERAPPSEARRCDHHLDCAGEGRFDLLGGP